MASHGRGSYGTVGPDGAGTAVCGGQTVVSSNGAASKQGPEAMTAQPTWSAGIDDLILFGSTPDVSGGEPRLACSGCGQLAHDITRLDAARMIHAVKGHGEGLLAHPVESLRARGRRGSSSPLESVAMVGRTLGGANTRLRHGFGVDADEQEVARITLTPPGVLASVVVAAERLVATINGATTRAWEGTRLDDGTAVAEMLWLALHDAVHHLEDAELALRARGRASHPAGAAADLRRIGAPRGGPTVPGPFPRPRLSLLPEPGPGT